MQVQTLTFSRLDIVKKNIKQECKDRGITIAELCKRLGKNRCYIAQMRNPGLDKIINIADAIGCKLEDVFAGI